MVSRLLTAIKSGIWGEAKVSEEPEVTLLSSSTETANPFTDKLRPKGDSDNDDGDEGGTDNESDSGSSADLSIEDEEIILNPVAEEQDANKKSKKSSKEAKPEVKAKPDVYTPPPEPAEKGETSLFGGLPQMMASALSKINIGMVLPTPKQKDNQSLKCELETQHLMYNIPCEITSSSHMPYRTTSSSSPSSLKPISSAERILLEMSEMRSFVQRPSTTPQTLTLPNRESSINGNAESYRKKYLRTRSPSQNSKSRSRRTRENERPISDDALTSISRAAFGLPKKSHPGTSPSSSYYDLAKRSTSETFEHLHSSVNNIIAEEDEEFRERYSHWIAQWFHTQLTKMKEKVIEQFVQKLNELSADKDAEIQTLHQTYNERIKAFEVASVKFRQWVNTLEEENRRAIRSKDEAIAQMQIQLEKTNQNLTTELDRQRILLKTEAEHQKMELITHHEEVMDRLMSNLQRPSNPVIRGHLDSLQNTLASLKAENEALKSQLRENSSKRARSPSAEALGTWELERRSLLKNIEQLQTKVDEVEFEKEALHELHHQTTEALAKIGGKSLTDLTMELQKATETIESLTKKHEREVKDLKMSMLNQETKYNKTFLQLKHKYGDKIDNLTKMIDRLQGEVHD